MRQRVRARRHRRSGYTLTEMLVVIAIIGLIAAVLTPNLLGQLGRARTKAARLQLETISAGLEMYRSDLGRYPTSGEGLRALIEPADDSEGWTGPYVRDASILKDPWGAEVRYRIDEEGARFQLRSLGADKQEGGRGADADLVHPTNSAGAS